MVRLRSKDRFDNMDAIPNDVYRKRVQSFPVCNHSILSRAANYVRRPKFGPLIGDLTPARHASPVIKLRIFIGCLYY